ncbi:MAG: FAD-binding oxidoreductase [Clostridiales bacterium]|nr:FAD-binding oxidoreductase [Clostridiales bacterium]
MALLQPFDNSMEDYLSDESLLTGFAQWIAFPQTRAEVEAALEAAARMNLPYTIQGSRTGLVGGAVPQGGLILNLSRLSGIGPIRRQPDGSAAVEVYAGVTLEKLRAALRRQGLFWPPQPTEPSATVGGVCATGARGPNACHFGGSEAYVLEKDTVQDVIVSARLKLLPLPEERWGLGFFFLTDEALCRFVDDIQRDFPWDPDAAIWSVEYLDCSAIDLIESHRQGLSAIRGVPVPDPDFNGMVYCELAGAADGLEALCDALMDLAEGSGCDLDRSWAVTGDAETDRLNAYRHAAAECCNTEIAAAHRSDPTITKLGTDYICRGMTFGETLEMYRSGLRETGLRGVLFGHAWENHLHVNLLPATGGEHRAGEGLVRRWAEECLAAGGSLNGEHGLGKLKAPLLGDLCGD